MNYKIYPINQGYSEIGIHDVLYRNNEGTILKFAWGAFLLKGEDGSYIMVDTGAPSCEEIESRGYPLRHTKDNIQIADQVRKAGADPAQIKLAIMTHLHWDHAWNVDVFPNATFIVQEKEMNAAVHPMKIYRKSYGLMEQSNGPDWIRALMRFKTVKGDKEIVPGIRVITTPGHSDGSQSVLVDTAEGTYMLPGDWIMNKLNLERETPTGSNPDVAAWYESLEKVQSLELAGILPCHDPETYERVCYG